jgi:hypothetical protein
MIVSYDIDGVLAAQPPASEKRWGKMNGDERKERKSFLNDWYRNAEWLLIPLEEKFHTISARKLEPAIYNITEKWLSDRYGERVLSINMLRENRTVENVVKFKSNVILELGIERHYEDNKKVLRGMRKLLPSSVELYFWEKGMTIPVSFD